MKVKDKLYIRTKGNLSFKMRLGLLFSTNIKMETVIDFSEIVPPHEVKSVNITAETFLDKICFKWNKLMGKHKGRSHSISK